MRALPRAKAVLGTFSSTRAGRLIDLLIYQPECKMPELHSLMFALCQIQVPSVRIVYWVKGHVLLLSAIPAMHQLLPCCSGNAAVSTRGIPRKKRFQPSPKRLFQVQQKGLMPSEGHFHLPAYVQYIDRACTFKQVRLTFSEHVSMLRMLPGPGP